MGIDGLLPLLRPVTQKEHISSFRNQRIAIDGLPWLYKGCYGYTFQLNQQVDSVAFMYYVLQMLELMSFYSIKPVMVFDGRSLARKSATLEKRMKQKMENKKKAMESLAKDDVPEARKYFSRCIVIDQRIISTTFDCLRAKGVEIIVAPYEADSQIGKLIDLGYVDTAISQDSDLLLYGVNMILKLSVNGECDYIDLKKVDREAHRSNPALYKWLRFSLYDRIRACVMAGCDYLDNIHGIGMKKAIGLIHSLSDQSKIVEKLLNDKNFKQKVPQSYELNVLKTTIIFLCAKIYNPQTNKLEYFSDPQLHNQKLKFSKQELEELLGSDYDYTEDVKIGKVKCTTLEKRECKPVDFKTFFCLPLNQNNLLVQEVRHRIRQHEEISTLESVFSKEQLQQAMEAEKQEQERLDKERKRLEQEKRLQNLKVDNFLTNIMDSFMDDDEEEPSDSKTEVIQTQEQDEIQECEQESESVDYQKLNPFLKRPC